MHNQTCPSGFTSVSSGLLLANLLLATLNTKLQWQQESNKISIIRTKEHSRLVGDRKANSIGDLLRTKASVYLILLSIMMRVSRVSTYDFRREILRMPKSKMARCAPRRPHPIQMCVHPSTFPQTCVKPPMQSRLQCFRLLRLRCLVSLNRVCLVQSHD